MHNPKNHLAIAYSVMKKNRKAHGGELKLGTGKRFEHLEHSLAHKPGIHDPAALAAAIGRKKFGKKRFDELEHHEHLSDGGEVEHQDDELLDDEPEMVHEEVEEPNDKKHILRNVLKKVMHKHIHGK